MDNEIRFRTSAVGSNLKTLMASITNGGLDKGTDLVSVMGGESLLSTQVQEYIKGLSYSQKLGVAKAITSANDGETFSKRISEAAQIAKSSGFESFSAQLAVGEVTRQKAATIDFNSRTNRQWDAPEAMYPTIIIPYDQETLVVPINIAGVGNYNTSGNGHEAFEDLRPIASILSDSTFSAGDDLKLVPVLPSSSTDSNFGFFVPAADWTPWDVTYDQNDALGREPHKTNYLAIKKINNLMSICRAPGSVAFENNDEIESNSIRLQSLLLKIKTKDGDGVAVLDTSNMASTAARPSTGTTADEKRQINFNLNGINVINLKDKDGKPVEFFKSLTDAGIKVFLQVDLTATYHRSTRAWSPTVAPLTIAYIITKTGERLVPGSTTMPDDLAALITAQALEGTIHGIEPKMNHSNTNISRYGITVMYANTTKSYAVYRRTPISLKYPKLDEDKNAEVLASLVKDMSVIVTRNMSHDAFKAANRHFNYLYDNNGMKIVPINDDSNSILPGQHFLTTTAIDSKIKLSEEVSTLDTSDALKNIRSALVNKIYDIITAIRINSNISALKEMDSRKETYIIVAHASLAPFLMEVGDYRTFGKDIDFEVIETNIDTEVGRMWIFPKSHTTENNIDVFGGLGINVAKESLVIEGFVGQSDRQYRMILTQPAYQHHDICPVLGRLTIEDIKDLLGDEGLISKINKLLIRGDLITSEPDDDVVIDLP